MLIIALMELNIFTGMPLVSFFFLTLTLIFKVKLGILFHSQTCSKWREMKQTLQLLPKRSHAFAIVMPLPSLIILYIVTLTYIFSVTKFEMPDIWKAVRASAKCSIMTFIAVDIRNRIRPLRMLYS